MQDVAPLSDQSPWFDLIHVFLDLLRLRFFSSGVSRSLKVIDLISSKSRSFCAIPYTNGYDLSRKK
jgi:hypothetical protein